VVTGIVVLCQVVQQRENAGEISQVLDAWEGVRVKKPALSGLEPLPDVSDGGERLERAGNELSAAAPARFVAGFGLDELRVGENDPELVVQSVKEQGQIGVIVHGG
jgi:hypothetical protein